jgi:hypothetical protein
VREPKRRARLGCLWMMVMTTGSMGEPGSHKPVRAPTRDTSVKFTQAQYIEYQTELDGYSRSAGLAGLKDGQPDQLRLWITGSMILPEPEDVDGYVVTKDQTSICRAKSPISQTSNSTQRRDCTPDHRLSRQDVVYLQIRNLADLSGWQLGCGVQDGEWYRIDGYSTDAAFHCIRATPSPASTEVPDTLASSCPIFRDIRSLGSIARHCMRGWGGWARG